MMETYTTTTLPVTGRVELVVSPNLITTLPSFTSPSQYKSAPQLAATPSLPPTHNKAFPQIGSTPPTSISHQHHTSPNRCTRDIQRAGSGQLDRIEQECRSAPEVQHQITLYNPILHHQTNTNKSRNHLAFSKTKTTSVLPSVPCQICHWRPIISRIMVRSIIL
jgi:hypothetical protein